MSTSIPQNVSTILQSNWNDAIGITKASIQWVATRPEIESWFKTATQNYLIACYCGQTRSTMVAQDTWRIDEPIIIDILIKPSDTNFSTTITTRETLKNEVERIIHSYQTQISGVAFAWVIRENAVEQFRLFRQIIVINCLYFHVKT
jgi:hypothetical protein